MIAGFRRDTGYTADHNHALLARDNPNRCCVVVSILFGDYLLGVITMSSVVGVPIRPSVYL